MNRKDRRRQAKAGKRAQGRSGANRRPDFDPQAVFAAALADQKAGRLAEAEAAYRRILADYPENARLNVNLAIVLRQQGRLEEAAVCCRTAVDGEPALVPARLVLGSIETDLGRPDRALEHFDAALKTEPDTPGALVNRSIALRDLSRYEEAAVDCRRAVELAPDMFEARNTLGAIHQAAGRLDAAEQAYRDTLARFPDHPEVLTNLGSVHVRRGRYDDAIGCYEVALAAAAEYGEAHLNKGIALRELSRFDEAADSFRRALAIDPARAGAQVNLGTALAAMERIDESLTCYDDALRLDPDLAEAHVNRGNALRDLGRLDEAIVSYRTALDRQPRSVVAHFNLGLALLCAGVYEEGWREHEWRWRTDTLKPFCRDFGQPQWDGSPLGRRTLLVWNEQGIGDEIMFSLCLPDLMAREPDAHILLECDSRLAAMMRRTHPAITVLPRDRFDTRGDGVARPHFDLHVPAGSLQQFFRRTAGDFPAAIKRLRADEEKVDAWRQRLAALGDGLKVGIAGRGGVMRQMAQQKTMLLEAFGPVLGVPSVHFVNLQYGDCADDLATAADTFGVVVHDWPDPDPITDIEGQAALIANLDLVVQTSNASAHAAGALGVPVWNLIPAAPDWRWGTDGADWHWYPSMRLFRQSVTGDWSGLAVQVAAALRSAAAGGTE